MVSAKPEPITLSSRPSCTGGRSLGRQYTEVRSIGRGSFGEASLVKDGSGKLCVMKTIDITKLDKEQQGDAANEVKVLSSLKHPYIVRYHESFVENGTLAIVMDYAEGGDLAKRIARHREKQQPFTEGQLLRWFTQVALGLKYLHNRHIIHRDLKPQNIFLTREDLRIGDFGISKTLGSSDVKEETTMGTPYYFSPEICREKLYSFASDIWALGCILYELAALKVPFEATNIPSLIRKITGGKLPAMPSTFSNDLRLLCSGLLSRDYSRRPTAVEILQNTIVQTEMRQMLNEKPTRSEASTSPPLSSTTSSRASTAESRSPELRRMLGSEVSAGRMLGPLSSLLKPLPPSDKDVLKRSPSAPAPLIPLPEGRPPGLPPTLRKSGSTALISSNGAIKASPEMPKRFDFESKSAWGQMPAAKAWGDMPGGMMAPKEASEASLAKAWGDMPGGRTSSKEAPKASPAKAWGDVPIGMMAPKEASKEGVLDSDIAIGHRASFKAAKPCASPLLGVGGAARSLANRAVSRFNRRRPALPVWQTKVQDIQIH